MCVYATIRPFAMLSQLSQHGTNICLPSFMVRLILAYWIMLTLSAAAISGSPQDIFDPGSKLSDAEHHLHPAPSPTTSPILSLPILPKSPKFNVLLSSSTTVPKEKPPPVSLHGIDAQVLELTIKYAWLIFCAESCSSGVAYGYHQRTVTPMPT